MSVTRGSHPEKHELLLISISDNPAPEFDWYTATIHGQKPQVIIQDLQKAFPLSSLRQVGGRNGYDRAAEVYSGDKKLAHIKWSSNGANPGVSVEGTSENSRAVRDAIQHYEHRVSRADVRIDYVEDGLFDCLASFLEKFAVQNKITLNHQGDWVRGKSRTLYLGSKDSVCQMRLYEKGHKEGGDPNWIRMEVQIRPKGKAGYACAKWEPAQYLGSIAWVKKALKTLQIDYENTNHSLGTVRKPTDESMTRLAMIRQYHKIGTAWIQENPEEFVQNWMETTRLFDIHNAATDPDQKHRTYLDLINYLEGKPRETGRRHKSDDRARTVRSDIPNYEITPESRRKLAKYHAEKGIKPVMNDSDYQSSYIETINNNTTLEPSS